VTTCQGDAGRNTIVGTDGPDVIKGGRGNDFCQDPQPDTFIRRCEQISSK